MHTLKIVGKFRKILICLLVTYLEDGSVSLWFLPYFLQNIDIGWLKHENIFRYVFNLVPLELQLFMMCFKHTLFQQISSPMSTSFC